ncbi:MAG: polymerase most-like protein containing domain hydrolase domain and Zn-ribbon domain [Rhodocyclaceae bacterium]|nr:polymerase most-like protein containing domain hydrolase domain and Zn-ribbon domain [Rhodocyclaceae bacterium]
MASVSSADQEDLKPSGPSGNGDFVLPGFIELRPDGVYVDAGKLASADDFLRAVDRVFNGGHFFGGLDYPLFQRLLYGTGPAPAAGPLRLASAIRDFPPARRALYKGVKIAGGEAAYMFEPVTLESAAAGSEAQVSPGKASLDVDEFIADLWTKGVRFGIDVAAVQAAIREGRCERVVVARGMQPTPGEDAGVKEQAAELHRDNAPRRLPDGRVDLGQFKNRFPQIRKGTMLLKKIPRELGKAGRTVAGERVEPPVPKDFDLASLAGEGTLIESRDGCEYIVAAMDGFLNLDTATNRVAITEKVINREGVSARTTGNLVLTGDEYEDFGEVQEGRVVEGKSLTFHANVFGKVLSTGGAIVLDKNLVGGAALNRDGSIAIAGLASNALVQTAHGALHLKRAENSVLIGDRVEVEWASNCTILAEEAEIQVSEGCTIAGKRIHVGTGDARNGEETLVSILLPDCSGIDHAQEKQRKHIAECEELMAGLKSGIEHLMSEPEVHKYFIIAGKIHHKEITLTPEQQGHWHQMCVHLGPTLKRIAQGREDIKALEGEIVAAQERIATLEAERAKTATVMECRVDSIQGDVAVRTLTIPLDAPPLSHLPPRELKLRLRASETGSHRLFAGSTGVFSWQPE